MRQVLGIHTAVLGEQRNHLLLQFIQPVLEQDQELGVGHSHKLFGLGHPVHQLLTHVRWIDTFVQAFRQSEVHHAGHLVVAGAADEVNHEVKAVFLRDRGQKLF